MHLVLNSVRTLSLEGWARSVLWCVHVGLHRSPFPCPPLCLHRREHWQLKWVVEYGCRIDLHVRSRNMYLLSRSTFTVGVPCERSGPSLPVCFIIPVTPRRRLELVQRTWARASPFAFISMSTSNDDDGNNLPPSEVCSTATRQYNHAHLQHTTTHPD